MRPYAGSHYNTDRDPAHFRIIVNYLRGGAQMSLSILPHERRYLLELLVGHVFYMLSGLEALVLDRLWQFDQSDQEY